MSKNIKTIRIWIPNETVLLRIKSTPALKKLSRKELVVGYNTENVNHYQYSDMQRLLPILGCRIEEIKK